MHRARAKKSGGHRALYSVSYRAFFCSVQPPPQRTQAHRGAPHTHESRPHGSTPHMPHARVYCRMPDHANGRAREAAWLVRAPWFSAVDGRSQCGATESHTGTAHTPDSMVVHGVSYEYAFITRDCAGLLASWAV